MSYFSIPNIAIRGISAAVPANKESNWDYDILNDREKKLLIRTTGVETRRRAKPGVTTSDLCFESAQKLLNDLQWKPEEISILIFVSQSPDYYLPATSIILQDRLGLPKSCMAFDVGLGCSGFVYGLSIISSLMATTGMKKGLLMAGDVSSATCSYEDKSTYPLFGDAGTVTALEIDPKAEKMTFDVHSDGSGYESIIIPDGGIRNLVSEKSFEQKDYGEGIRRADLNLALNGIDVFNFSINEVPNAVNSFLNETNTSVSSYDYFIMHQANKLMNETIRKKVKMESEKVPYSIDRYGNTSSASIPLTIVTELGERVNKDSTKLLISGFGVGLSWGVASIKLDNIVCPKLLEV